MANRQLKILRGAPGSGKSFYTAKNFPGAVVCSADSYFVDVVGEGKEYKFDVKLLGEAHKECMRKFLISIMNGADLVAIDNTSLQVNEFIGYIQAAQAMGYEVEVVRLDTPVEVASARNIHGVPAKKVEEMAKRFQNLPGFIRGVKETIVKGV